MRTLPVGEYGRNGRFHFSRAGGHLEILEHHGGAEDGGDRIDDAAAGDIGRGAVHGLEHRRKTAERIEICASGESHAANDDGGDVAENVAKEIRADDDVETLGATDEVHGGGVNQQRFGFDIGKLRGHFAKDAVP